MLRTRSSVVAEGSKITELPFNSEVDALSWAYREAERRGLDIVTLKKKPDG